MQSFLRLHRLGILFLAAGFSAFILWATLADLDIVVTAQGKLVPVNFVQVAQPAESGIVRRVLVADGDTVKAGQPLVEMDPVFAQADSKSAEAEASLLRQQLARITAEQSGATLAVTDPQVLSDYLARRAAYQALCAEAQSALALARAELETARQRMAKAGQLAPVARQQAAMLEKLEASGFVSKAALNDKRLGQIEAEQEEQVQARAVAAAEAAVRQAQAALARVDADYRRQLAAERTDITARLAQAEATLSKSAHREALTVLRAPVAGVVTGLFVKSANQVVGAGTVLLSLVPQGEPLRFEGWMRNEDSAFVTPDMPAKVKLSAYPFQKYGWLEGSVTWLGVDSETPESMRNVSGEPLFYRVRVEVPQALLGKQGGHPLKPGMQAIADVQIGTRTPFEYLISPVRKVALESARER